MTSRVICGPWGSSCTSCEYHPPPPTPASTLCLYLSMSYFSFSVSGSLGRDFFFFYVSFLGQVVFCFLCCEKQSLKLPAGFLMSRLLAVCRSPQGSYYRCGVWLPVSLGKGREWVCLTLVCPTLVPNDLFSFSVCVDSHPFTPTRARPSLQE